MNFRFGEARAKVRAEVEVVLVPGATDLFEEPGALEAVAELACGWFSRHLHVDAAISKAHAK